MRESFVFYKSFLEAIDELEPDIQLKVYQAIARYSLKDELPELTGIAKAIFSLIKPQIDANNKRYENGKKGAGFGVLGGRPKKQKPQENPKKTPNVNENENENVNVNDNVITLTPLPPLSEKKECVSEGNCLKTFSENTYNPDCVASGRNVKYFDIYEQLCPELPKIRFERRNRKVLALLDDFIREIDDDVGYFREVCTKANEQKLIVNTKIDFKTLIRNHSKIYNECCLNSEIQAQKEKDDYTSTILKWELEQKNKDNK